MIRVSVRVYFQVGSVDMFSADSVLWSHYFRVRLFLQNFWHQTLTSFTFVILSYNIYQSLLERFRLYALNQLVNYLRLIFLVWNFKKLNSFIQIWYLFFKVKVIIDCLLVLSLKFSRRLVLDLFIVLEASHELILFLTLLSLLLNSSRSLFPTIKRMSRWESLLHCVSSVNGVWAPIASLEHREAALISLVLIIWQFLMLFLRLLSLVAHGKKVLFTRTEIMLNQIRALFSAIHFCLFVLADKGLNLAVSFLIILTQLLNLLLPTCRCLCLVPLMRKV